MDNVRTANVSSENYSTLGGLNLKTLHRVCSNYDTFLWALTSKVYNYDDSQKMFLQYTLQQIDYLKLATKGTIIKLALSMKRDWLGNGAVLFKPNDLSQCLMIV